MSNDDAEITPYPGDEPSPPAPELPSQVQFLGEYLLARGLINEDQLEAALNYQESVNLPIGALALGKGLLSEKQLLIIHAQQWTSDDRFGEIAVRRGFMTRGQLDDLLREQKEGRVLLGEALVRHGAIERATLQECLVEYQVSQVKAERNVRGRLRALQHASLVSPTVQLTTRLLLRMGGIVAKLAAVSEGTRLAPYDYLVWQEVTGTQPYTYALALNTREVLDLADSMLLVMGDDTELGDEVDPVILDVVKEFVNILVGHVCTWQSREGINGMPLPPDAAEGAFEPPVSWEGPTRRINVSLVMTRGDLALSILVPEPPEGEQGFVDEASA